ncbi:MAG: hypothetical protein KF708_20040 [Pirellulales bacterium]|nr:hypothetical protein [Pirellulales bacterium]
MKKPKLDLSKIKTLLIEHVEKIVLGIFGVLFLYFTYKGFTLEKYDKTPVDLQNEVQRATTHVTSSTFDPKREEMVFVDPTTTVAQNNVQINAAEFPLAPMNPPEFPPANKRGEPQYLAVEDLQLSSGFGTFQLKQGGAIAPPAGNAGSYAAKRWICVTGLIPYERQRLLYHEQFAKRGGSEPEWVAYRVERAEVGNIPGAEPEWKVLPLADSATQQAQWSGVSPELIPEDFRVAQPKSKSVPMLYPLGPRVGSNWTPDEVNHPKVLSILAAEKPAVAAPAAPAAAGDPLATAPAEAPVIDVFDPDAAPAPVTPAPKPADKPAVKPVRDVRVFRFFDFNVTPGKRYQYRVLLYLTNPNLGQAARDLVDPKLAVGPYRTTDFSAPSPAITVPHDAGVLLAGVEQAKGANEIGLVVIARQLTADGSTALAKKTARRGEEINFRATPAEQATVVRAGGTSAVRSNAIEIRTESLVVDILEGANAAGGTDARALVLGPDGRLVVKTQSNDTPEVAKAEADFQRASETEPAAPAPVAGAEPANKEKKQGAGGSLLEQPAATRGAAGR